MRLLAGVDPARIHRRDSNWMGSPSGSYGRLSNARYRDTIRHDAISSRGLGPIERSVRVLEPFRDRSPLVPAQDSESHADGHPLCRAGFVRYFERFHRAAQAFGIDVTAIERLIG